MEAGLLLFCVFLFFELDVFLDFFRGSQQKGTLVATKIQECA